VCAEMCSTKALLAGDADVLSNIYRDRVTIRAARGTLGGPPWGWDAAYGTGDKTAAQPPAQQPQPAAPATKS
ncbi:MAG: formate dehydrogenase, partial [Betaproteobacteria bacterium]